MRCLRTVKTNSAKSFFLNACFFAAFALELSGAAGARELTDALGTSVKLADHPARIVTLAPSLGELAADLLGDQLDSIVGVSDYTDYPAALSKVKSIGSYARFNLETVAGLKPDLIIATSDGNARDQIEHLRELHLPVVVVKTSSFSDIDQSMAILSQALGVEKAGESLRSRFQEGLKKISARTAARRASGAPAPQVLLQLDGNPLVVAGSGTFLNEALLKIGAENLYSDIRKPYPKPTVEDVVRRDPDVILLLGMEKNLNSFEKAAKDWQRFPKMKAMHAGRIRVIRADEIIRPSLRVLEGLALLEQAVYGK
jgi:iron complex transport system substrate-binding protein